MKNIGKTQEQIIVKLREKGGIALISPDLSKSTLLLQRRGIITHLGKNIFRLSDKYK